MCLPQQGQAALVPQASGQTGSHPPAWTSSSLPSLLSYWQACALIPVGALGLFGGQKASHLQQHHALG